MARMPRLRSAPLFAGPLEAVVALLAVLTEPFATDFEALPRDAGLAFAMEGFQAAHPLKVCVRPGRQGAGGQGPGGLGTARCQARPSDARLRCAKSGLDTATAARPCLVSVYEMRTGGPGSTLRSSRPALTRVPRL